MPEVRDVHFEEDETQPRERKSTVWAVLMVLALLAAVWWVLKR